MSQLEIMGAGRLLDPVDARNYALRPTSRARQREANLRTREIFSHPNPIDLLCAAVMGEQSSPSEQSLEEVVASIDSLGKMISAVIRANGEIIEADSAESSTSASIRVEKMFFGKGNKPFFLLAEEKNVGYFIDPHKGDDQPRSERVMFNSRGGALSIEVKEDKTRDSKQRILSVGLRSDRLSDISDSYRYLPVGGFIFDHIGGTGLVELRKKIADKEGRNFERALKEEDKVTLHRYYAALLSGGSALLSGVFS